MSLSFIIFQSMYAIVKDFLGFTKRNNLLQRCLIFLGILILILALLIIWLPCTILYLLVFIYLKLKFGNSFAGMVHGQDVIMECGDDSVVISCVIVVNSANSFDNFLDTMTKRCHILLESCRKVSYVLRTCLGYSYYLKKDNIKIEEFLSVVNYKGEEFLTKDMIMDILTSNRLNADFLGDKMFNLTLFEQPLHWNTKSTKTNYAILISLRHCVGDGAGILSLFYHFICSHAKFIPVKSNNSDGKNLGNKSLDDLYVHRNIWSTNSNHLKPKHKPKHLLSWFAEDEVKYIPMVKRIKDRLKVGFSEVILAAITASMIHHTKKRYQDINKITGGVIFKPLNANTKKMISGDYDYHNINNDSAEIVMNIPVNIGSDKMVDRVHETHKMAREVRGASEIPFNYALSKLLFLLPSPLVFALTSQSLSGLTFNVSNVAGIESASFDEDVDAEAFGFNVPQFYGIDFQFGVFSVGSRLQITLSSSTGMVHDRDELDDIISNTLKYIDILDDEITLAQY